jgi:hypothetical protein
MSQSSVDVLVPIYQTALAGHELLAVDRAFKVVGNHGVTFFGPSGLDVSFYSERYPNARFRFYSAEFFKSLSGYSRLLLSEMFYDDPGWREFLLIVQPDAYLFRDDLDRWVHSPFDYIGAPWPDGYQMNIAAGKFAEVGGRVVRAHVGNGGLSLRRRSKCAALIREHTEIANWFVCTGSNEDLFFAFLGMLSSDFVLPNQMTASEFSWELKPEEFYRMSGGVLPMGVHGFDKNSPEFWRLHIPELNS